MVRCWYLQDPDQECSDSILIELGLGLGLKAAEKLGVVDESELSPDHLGQAFADTAKEIRREHCLVEEGHQAYVIKDGRIYIDLRNSANEWIRVVLSDGDAIVIPNTLWRRIVLPDDPWVILERRASSPSTNPSDKLKLHVKKYRFPSNEDEKHLEALTGQARATHTDTRQLIVELCRQFYELGWVTGTGGSISIRHGNRVYMTPSGVQKERMLPEELYVLDMSGNQLYTPEAKPGRSRLKLTACAPLFFHSYRIRDAGAVIHSHGMECVLATLLHEGQTEFRITHQEMIKGIAGHGFLDELVIPIIENTPQEADLADSLGDAIRRYPKATAVLVRYHGIYIWGATWMQAKTQAECYHYLFKLAVEMHHLGVDYTKVPQALEAGACCNEGGHHHAIPAAAAATSSTTALTTKGGGGGKRSNDGPTGTALKYILMDIEGTTTSISFVHDTLFPYAKSAVEKHVKDNIKDPELLADIQALREQANADIKAGTANVPVIPGPEASDNDVIKGVLENVYWQMSVDRKTTALKQLQGHIWRAGYESGVLRSHVYDDVPEALERWTKRGLKCTIYSSGSREAQRLLFGNTDLAGDLRRYLGCYFDTTVGGKREASSYVQITLSLGVDHPSEILFLTDIPEEAIAAREAGLQAVLSVRPGNAPLVPATSKGFSQVTSFDQVDAIIDSITPLSLSKGSKKRKL